MESKESETKSAEEAKGEQSWNLIDFSEVKVGEMIGGGGVGLIYRGTFRGQPVALKTLFDPKVDAGLMKEYMDELLVMSKLEHPNVVKLLGACMRPPNLCMVMELAEASLFDMLHKQRLNFSCYERVQIALDVASALKYLHCDLSPPIVHRDLKSHNLLVKRGIVKLCDFGLVRTQTALAGTPCYMAPELLSGGGVGFNKSVDVYSFAIVLWEIFAQEIPFTGYDIDDIRRAVARGDRPRIPTVDTPVEARELMAACWHQNPGARPGFEEIERRLSALLSATPQHSELESLEGSGGFGGDALDDLVFSGK